MKLPTALAAAPMGAATRLAMPMPDRTVTMGVTRMSILVSFATSCAALGLTGLAGGAAVAGCCAQMVGFAVMSFRENGWGGLVAQGIGTSMLQMPNIVKNPRIWIPPTLASAITGPLATCLFHLEMNGTAVMAVFAPLAISLIQPV